MNRETAFIFVVKRDYVIHTPPPAHPLVFAINIRHISSHKIIFLGLEPQWYFTQRVVLSTIDHLIVVENPQPLIMYMQAVSGHENRRCFRVYYRREVET